MMHPPYWVKIATSLHPGLHRHENEDAVAFHIPDDWRTLVERGTLIVVADGVGGLRGGDLASDYAVRTLIEQYYTLPGFSGVEATLLTCLETLNAHIQRAFHPAATTIVAAVIQRDTLTVAHVGDSRAYWQHVAGLEQLTQDHVVVAQRADGRSKNKLTQALGHHDAVTPSFTTRQIRPGDRIILVTDGVTRYHSTPDLARLCQQAGDTPGLARLLVTEANRAGGIDNIGVAVAEIGPPVASPSALADSLLREPPQHVAAAEIARDAAPSALSDAARLSVTPPVPPVRSRRGLLIMITVLLAATAVAAGSTLMPQLQPEPVASDLAASPVHTDAPLATASTIMPALPTPAAGPAELEPGVTIIVNEAAPTYVRISENVTAFVLEAGQIYSVHELFEYNAATWIRLFDVRTERYGWIEKNLLPAYSLAD